MIQHTNVYDGAPCEECRRAIPPAGIALTGSLVARDGTPRALVCRICFASGLAASADDHKPNACADCGEFMWTGLESRTVYCVGCGARRFVPGYRAAVGRKDRV